MTAAGELMVIETETLSSGMPSNSVSISSSEETGDAALADFAVSQRDGRHRSPSAWADRRRRRGRSGPVRGDSGSGGWFLPAWKSRRTGAWSRAGRGTSFRGCRGCKGNVPVERITRGIEIAHDSIVVGPGFTPSSWQTGIGIRILFGVPGPPSEKKRMTATNRTMVRDPGSSSKNTLWVITRVHCDTSW